MKVGARYYDPQVGTFLTRDTYLDEKPYLYCEHDPVNAVDPSGHKGLPPWVTDWLTALGGPASALMLAQLTGVASGTISVSFVGVTVIATPVIGVGIAGFGAGIAPIAITAVAIGLAAVGGWAVGSLIADQIAEPVGNWIGEHWANGGLPVY